MNGGLFSLSLPLGHVAGILVRVHWTLLVLWVFNLNAALKKSEGSAVVVYWGVEAGLMFLSIFLHELGHCFAARRVGGRAEEILLWPLGGLAFCDCPETWRSRLTVAAGGPLVTILIVALSWLGFGLADDAFPSALLNPYYRSAKWILIQWNIFILFFNLIPLYPMDGGRMFHALAWAWFGRHGSHPLNGYGRASRLTLWVTWATAAAGIALAVHFGVTLVAVLLLLMAFEAGSLRR